MAHGVHPTVEMGVEIVGVSIVGIFFGLFVILTIIIKYLQIIVELVFKRKNYSYDSIEYYAELLCSVALDREVCHNYIKEYGETAIDSFILRLAK